MTLIILNNSNDKISWFSMHCYCIVCFDLVFSAMGYKIKGLIQVDSRQNPLVEGCNCENINTDARSIMVVIGYSTVRALHIDLKRPQNSSRLTQQHWIELNSRSFVNASPYKQALLNRAKFTNDRL